MREIALFWNSSRGSLSHCSRFDPEVSQYGAALTQPDETTYYLCRVDHHAFYCQLEYPACKDPIEESSYTYFHFLYNVSLVKRPVSHQRLGYDDFLAIHCHLEPHTSCSEKMSLIGDILRDTSSPSSLYNRHSSWPNAHCLYSTPKKERHACCTSSRRRSYTAANWQLKITFLSTEWNATASVGCRTDDRESSQHALSLTHSLPYHMPQRMIRSDRVVVVRARVQLDPTG